MAKPLLPDDLWCRYRHPLGFDPGGRPRRRSQKVRADKAYDGRHCRAERRARRIKARIARKGQDASQRLGRCRWIGERAHAWMARLRRLALRYERRDDIHLAFTLLGRTLVCMNRIGRFCQAP